MMHVSVPLSLIGKTFLVVDLVGSHAITLYRSHPRSVAAGMCASVPLEMARCASFAIRSVAGVRSAQTSHK
jgi:hypothetical protein